jgi:hypothetical protein
LIHEFIDSLIKSFIRKITSLDHFDSSAEAEAERDASSTSSANFLMSSSFDCSRESSDFNSSFNGGFRDGEVIPQVEFTCPDEVQVGNE